jgi:hypothetical protein
MSKVANQLLASVLVNAVYEMRNYPVILINTLISPLSFLVLIVLVTRGELLGVAILGGLIMTMFQSGMSLQADLSHLKNDFRLQEMVVASPTGPGTYVAGMALSELIYNSPSLRGADVDVPHLGVNRICAGVHLLGHRAELRVLPADHHAVLDPGTGVLSDQPNPLALPIPRAPFADHLHRPLGPGLGRVRGGDPGGDASRLRGNPLHHRGMPVDRGSEIEVEGEVIPSSAPSAPPRPMPPDARSWR